MKIALYDRVALKRDIPQHGVKAGDVATLVEYVQHPNGGEEGCVVELFNALGESIGVATLKVSEIEALRQDEVLSVRPLAKAV